MQFAWTAFLAGCILIGCIGNASKVAALPSVKEIIAMTVFAAIIVVASFACTVIAWREMTDRDKK
jgi:hypothetical protein